MVSEAKDKLLYTNNKISTNGSLSTWGQCPLPLASVVQWGCCKLGLRSLQSVITEIFLCSAQQRWIYTVMSLTSSQSHFPRSYSSQYSYICFCLCDIWVIVHEVGLGFAAAAELLVYIIWSPKWKAMKGPIVAIECVCNNVQHKYCTAICSGQFSQF